MNATVLIGCPTCGRRYRYDVLRFGAQGVRIRCRTCESVMRVDIPAALCPAPVTTESPMADPVCNSSGSAFGEPLVPPEPALQPREAEQREHLKRGEREAETVPARPAALVAEKDAALRVLLAAILREHGFDVHTVDDGDAARRALNSRSPEVVIMNVFLPHVLGVTLCADIRKNPGMRSSRILLVGSLYRRDRFMRNPEHLYGADGFIDGNGSVDEIRAWVDAFLAQFSSSPAMGSAAVDSDREALARLARTVVGDIILYNPDTAHEQLAAGRFLEAFAQELREGQRMVAQRFGHLDGNMKLYNQAIQDALEMHGHPATLMNGTGQSR